MKYLIALAFAGLNMSTAFSSTYECIGENTKITYTLMGLKYGLPYKVPAGEECANYVLKVRIRGSGRMQGTARILPAESLHAPSMGIDIEEHCYMSDNLMGVNFGNMREIEGQFKLAADGQVVGTIRYFYKSEKYDELLRCQKAEETQSQD